MKKLSLFEHTPRESLNRDNGFLSDLYVALSELVLSLLYHTGIPWMMHIIARLKYGLSVLINIIHKLLH